MTAYDTPTFTDEFASDDPARWIAQDTTNWPPRPGTPGKWSRCYYTGWPTNTSDDHSARFLNDELQCYEDYGVRIGPDGAELTATRGWFNHFNQPWASGVIVQNRDFALKYGYFEAVLKLPQEHGFWPAFWMLPAVLMWPPEFDFERPGVDANGQPSPGSVHIGLGGTTEGAWVTLPGDPAGFHKYGFLWTPGTLAFYIDDNLVASLPTDPATEQPMYMICDLAVGGSWAGLPDASVNTATAYVRRVSNYAAGSWDASKAIPTTPPVPAPLTGSYVETMESDGTIKLTLTPTPPAPPPPPPPPLDLQSLSVFLAEDPYQGDALAEIWVDASMIGTNIPVTALYVSGATQAVPCGQIDVTEPHLLSVWFKNDAFGGPGEDRNLYLMGYQIGTNAVVSGNIKMPDGSTAGTMNIPALASGAVVSGTA